MRRIGIYAGTFDPLHEGHLSFALAAASEASLECVYILPERHPRHKPHASAYDQRLAYIKEKTAGHPTLDILELPDERLSVHETLPELQKYFPGSQLVMLVGSDVVMHLPQWPSIKRLTKVCSFVIGIRHDSNETTINAILKNLGIEQSMFVRTDQAHLSSTQLRNNL